MRISSSWFALSPGFPAKDPDMREMGICVKNALSAAFLGWFLLMPETYTTFFIFALFGLPHRKSGSLPNPPSAESVICGGSPVGLMAGFVLYALTCETFGNDWLSSTKMVCMIWYVLLSNGGGSVPGEMGAMMGEFGLTASVSVAKHRYDLASFGFDVLMTAMAGPVCCGLYGACLDGS